MAVDWPDLSGISVLVVDDDEDTQTILGTYLRYLGAEVATVPEAREALAALPYVKPDAIVSDISMPGMDGCEFLERAKRLQNPAVPPTPAIAFTAYADRTFEARAMAAGYARYVSKPADPLVIAEHVGELVSAAREGRTAA